MRSIIIQDKFVLDIRSHLLTKEGKKVSVRPKALEVLVFLVENKERVVSREELGEHIWPETHVDVDSGLNVLIQALRRALEDSSRSSSLIETIPRRGYRFVGTAVEQESTKSFFRNKVFWLAWPVGVMAIILLAFFELGYLERPASPVRNLNDLNLGSRATYLEGLKFFDEGNFDQSRETFQELVLVEPDFSQGYYWLGYSQYENLNFNLQGALKAQPFFYKALKLNPEFPGALVELGRTELIIDLNATQAYELVIKALEQDPDNEAGLGLLGVIYFALGAPAEAVKLFERINLSYPTKDLKFGGEGWANFMAGNYQASARVCQSLLQSGVKSLFIQNCLFESYLALQNSKLASGAALDIMTTLGASSYEISKVKQGFADDSPTEFFLWLNEFYNYKSTNLHYSMAINCIRLGKIEKAVSILKRIVSEREFHYFALIESDPRLEPLKNHPEANKIFNQLH